jgi:Tol biopolymer transport system component
MENKCYVKFASSFQTMFLLLLTFTLSSQSFDIYKVDMKDLKSERITKLDNSGEFNPAISKKGGYIIHDVADGDDHNIYVTSLTNGESKIVEGAEGGNDGSFSPKGDWIAFDRVYVGDSSMYKIPAGGGERQLIRKYALDPDWSKDGKRLVFKDAKNGSIRTIGLDNKDETIVSLIGSNPTWSPNGKYIAFSDGSNIFTVPVSKKGLPNGQPNQVTEGTEDIFYQQPEWSNNSKSIICHANLNGSFDIWLIPVFGGSQVQVTSDEGGEFDPCYSSDGEFIIFSKLTEEE